MKRIEFIMGMPIIVNIVGENNSKVFKKVFDYFRHVDEVFSPYKQNSEVTKINDGRIKRKSSEMKLILRLCAETKKETDGYFDPYHDGTFDPSGLVKGWAIWEAAKMLENMKYKNFYIEASGDIQTHGLNQRHEKWKVGIKNPFNTKQIVKVVELSGEGIATSGNYEKGQHIYDPTGSASFAHNPIVSLTVIAKNVYEADRFSTPCFAVGLEGIEFLERQKGLEGYMIDEKGIATFTSSLEKYAHKNR